MERQVTLTLIGQYDSPFVRRVAVSLCVLEIPFERQPLSVFGDADALRLLNPLGRVPALVIEEGECLIDSSAILDYLDERVGTARALLPSTGAARREALKTVALATGIGDKAVAIAYERRRAQAKTDEAWILRYRTQQEGALAALDRHFAVLPAHGGAWTQAEITVACMLGYVRLREPDTLAPGSYPALKSLSARAEADPAFQACLPTVEEIGGPPADASAALLRLRGTPSSA